LAYYLVKLLFIVSLRFMVQPGIWADQIELIGCWYTLCAVLCFRLNKCKNSHLSG